MAQTPRQILITGGTGSFGKRFARTVLDRRLAETVRIYSRDELKQAEMAEQFGRDPRLRFLLGDVRDRNRLQQAMYDVDLVVHAAALKQVPICEYNPAEAVKTNIIGGQNVVDCAIEAGVARTVALSTDKAVNPVNIYGATKLCAEKLFVQGNVYSGPRQSRFACVRYGNVVGTRGSVIPIFREQARHGALSITDPAMTRFWISLDQAVDFVLRAVRNMVGGEIFVPRIPSMRVVDLARAIAPSAVLKCVGRRPGEKLHELLLTTEEAVETRDCGAHFVIGGSGPRRGRRVPEGFVYASDTNDQWLTVTQLQQLIHGFGPAEGGVAPRASRFGAGSPVPPAGMR